MNNSERELIMGLVRRSISEEEFLKEFPVDVKQYKQYVTKVLQEAVTESEPINIEYALMLGFYFEFEKEVVPVLCDLIVKDWHKKHEDIAGLLQDFKMPESVESLYKAALMEFDYLDHDDCYSFAIKCIWALGDINTGSSRDKLKELATSGNQIVKEAAEYQLSRH